MTERTGILNLANVTYTLISLIGLGFILTYTETIMIPFVLAVFVVLIVNPLIDLLRTRAKCPRSLAIVITAAIVILAIALLSTIISVSIREALEHIDEYRETLLQVLRGGFDALKEFGVDPSLLGKEQMLSSLSDLPVFSYVRSAASAMISLISNTFLVLLFVAFMLSGPSLGLGKNPTFRNIDHQVRKYLITKGLASIVTGLLTALILLFIGVDMAFMFGVLAFVLNFIPSVGSLIAMILPLPVALIEFGLSWELFAAFLGPGSVQFTIGNIIEPKIVGDSLDLHPVTVLLALMFWGLLWGVIGMLLAMPITVMIKIILEMYPSSRPFAELMAGRIAFERNQSASV